MQRAAFFLLTALSLLIAAPSLAAGDDAHAPTREADALFHRGSSAFDAGRFEQAYQFYLAAWQLKRTHDIAGNLAQVELKLGKHRDAAEHIAFAIAHFPPSATGQTDRRERMRKALDGLRKDLVVLRIRVSTSRARVVLDGRSLGEAPLDDVVFVEPGSHLVEATLEGHERAEARVDAPRGASREVALTVVPRAPAARTAALPAAPVAGAPPVDERSIKTRNAVVISSLILGGAALTTGVVMTVVSNGKSAHAASQHDAILEEGGGRACAKQAFQARCDALYGSYRGQATARSVAIAGYAAAGAALGGAALAYLLWPQAPQEKRPWTRARVAPAVGARERGFVITGSF